MANIDCSIPEDVHIETGRLSASLPTPGTVSQLMRLWSVVCALPSSDRFRAH